MTTTAAGNRKKSGHPGAALPKVDDFVAFEYLYRDTGVFKAFGRCLLRRRFGPEVEAALQVAVGGDGFFVAEQVGVPPLYAELRAL